MTNDKYILNESYGGVIANGDMTISLRGDHMKEFIHILEMGTKYYHDEIKKKKLRMPIHYAH
jgi:hypothetical protein